MNAKDKQRLYDAYNATSTDDPEGSDQLETYEAWLERQLLSRMNKESYASQQMPFICTAPSNLRSCSHYICGGCNHPSTCNYKKAQQMPSDDMSNIARRENYLITEKLIPSILSENVVNEEDYNLGWDDCFDWLKSLQQEKPNDKEK